MPAVTPSYAPRQAINANGGNGRYSTAVLDAPEEAPAAIAPPPAPVIAAHEPEDDDFDPFSVAPPTVTPPPAIEPATVAPISAEDPLSVVLAELRALRVEVEALKSGPPKSPAPTELLPFSHFVADAYRKLVDHELSPELARLIATEVETRLSEDAKSDYERVVATICDILVEHCTSRPLPEAVVVTAPRVLMLIGPTGVGKTTTLANSPRPSR